MIKTVQHVKIVLLSMLKVLRVLKVLKVLLVQLALKGRRDVKVNKDYAGIKGSPVRKVLAVPMENKENRVFRDKKENRVSKVSRVLKDLRENKVLKVFLERMLNNK